MRTPLYLTRDSLCAADDVLAPNGRKVIVRRALETPQDLQDAVAELAPEYLPGGIWVAFCGLPLAVVSDAGRKVERFLIAPHDMPLLQRRDGGFEVHFVHIEKGLPDLVFSIIERVGRYQATRSHP